MKREFGCAAGPLPGVRLALPVLDRRAAVQAFPPRLIVRGDCDVREDRVADHVERVAIGLAVRAGHDAEVAGLRVDRAQLAVGAEVQPAMSSPSVQTFQPGIEAGGTSIARLVLPQADGNAPRCSARPAGSARP